MKAKENIEPPYLFLIKFLTSFFILYCSFPAYRGLIGVGGKMYSPFLSEHFNFIVGFTKVLTASAKVFLETLGYQVHQLNFQTLRIENSQGIIVNPSCLGFAVISFWIAFVFANKGTVKHKVNWMLVGTALITLLNIARIALIALSNHLNWTLVRAIDHHQTFNIASYSCIIVLIGIYISCQKKYERHSKRSYKSRGQFSSV